ncbi:MAG: translation initiation factor IF-2 [Candidatus Tyloplasma litorale]|nr:MAG: translation initiation factor IF-2 [Mycoplasmatales bacterium]
MAKKKNKKNEHRLEFDLKEFFVEKLTFKNGKLFFGSNSRINDVANIIGIDIKKAMKDVGLSQNSNVNHILDDEQIAELALKNNIDFEKVEDVSAVNVVEKILQIMDKQNWDSTAEVITRPPIITIMGHVDHGKTTLLDTIRKSNLTSKEIGGITQTIGAYQIEVNGNKLTFIDTPGHEAFTEMRANGSKVTDIVIIVVAADDSIMPQTIESIDHAKAANVPMIVAVNKIDSVGANFDKVQEDLLKIGVVSEQMGGDVPFVPISALKNKGVDKLIENIVLMSEMQELKAPKNILASGTVIESNVDKNKGNLISVIVQNGTLKIGDNIIMDDFVSRIKSMHDDKGKIIREAFPGSPVEIFGIGQSPIVGSKFVVTKDKDAQKIANEIHDSRINQLRKITNNYNVADLFERINNSKKAFNIILKADSLGVLEAISSKLEGFSNDDVEVKIIRKDTGEISTTDITLAEASKASIYTFNLKTSPKIMAFTKNRNVNIFEFNIIYKMFEDVQNKINGLIEDKFEEKEIGKVEVKKLFTFSKIGTILGSIVREGSIKKDSIVEVIRDNKVILKTKVLSLQFEKSQLKEAVKGRECGIVLKDQKLKLQEGDILIAKELVKVN